ncbi:MAG: hypothetical protein V2I43_28770 [Parvularcula sp.]|jgi:nucleoside-diphosphate-sugar epimerase|nr:hypothetical protein [Parvularcula sp.]
MSSSQTTTVDPDEVQKFSAIAAEWWDPLGKFKPLHKFNPVRLALIRDEAAVRRLARGQDAAILIPILTLSAEAAPWLREEGVRRLVLFSSNNVSVDPQNPVYRSLQEAEAAAWGPGTVILRPTMIYGSPADKNLSNLLRTAKRFGALVCPGRGEGAQQPIHLRDLARAASLAATGTMEGTFAVAGPEPVPMKTLFAQVLLAVGRPEGRIVHLPLAAFGGAVRAAERLGLALPLSTAQLRRFDQDKTPKGAPLPGFSPTIGLRQGLADLAEQLAAEGAGR